MTTPYTLDNIISESTFGWKRAARWMAEQENPKQAWEACTKAEWMLWYCGAVAGPVGSADRVRLVLAACDCAELALGAVSPGENRPRQAIEAARAWARGELPLEIMEKAAFAAYETDGAGSTPLAAHAAYAAAFAAHAPNPHHDCSGAAVSAARAVASQEAVAFTRANQLPPAEGIPFHRERMDAVLRQCADIVRQHYPEPPAFREFW